MELLPAMDLRDGGLVRLLFGDYAAETRYAVTPEAYYDTWAARGARWLHVVDLDGAREGRAAHLAVIAALARRGRMRLQVGGGVRDAAAVERLLDAGVGRVVVGSLALSDPGRVAGWLDTHGVEAIVVAVDVRIGHDGEPRVATHGWLSQSTTTIWDALAPLLPHGLRHVLCTDVGRDGALAGPNEALYARAVQRHPALAWQASGGVRSVGDLAALARVGASAAICGRALLEGRIDAEELRPFLPNA